MSNTQNVTIKLRRGTAVEISDVVPQSGEPILNIETGEIRCGDGINQWKNLNSQVQQLTTPRAINGLKFDGSSDVSNYIICNTSDDNPLKELVISDITSDDISDLNNNLNNFLITGTNIPHGTLVSVRFIQGNTVVYNPTQNTGINFRIHGEVFPVVYNGYAVGSNLINSPHIIYDFVYDKSIGAFIYKGHNHNDYDLDDETNAIEIGVDGKLKSKLDLNYNSTDRKIYLQANGTSIGEIDTTDFIKDGFLQSVEYDSTTQELIFTWNLDRGDIDSNTEGNQSVTKVQLGDIIAGYEISSDNVIISENLTYTSDIGALKLGSASSNVIESQGMSLTNLLKTILAATIQPSISKMRSSHSFNASSLIYKSSLHNQTLDAWHKPLGYYEVGNYITGANVTISFTPGIYEYGYWINTAEDWNVTKVTTPNQSTGQTARYSIYHNTAYATDSTVTSISGTVSRAITFDNPVQLTSEGNNTNILVTDLQCSFNFANNSTRAPLDNVGGKALESDGKTIMTPIYETDTSDKITLKSKGGYYSIYYIGTDCTTSIDSDFIRKCGHGFITGGGIKGYNTIDFGTVTIPAGTKRVMFAVPGIHTITKCTDVDGMNLDLVSSGKINTIQINVDSANNYTTKKYSVFIFENSNGLTDSTRFIPIIS